MMSVATTPAPTLSALPEAQRLTIARMVVFDRLPYFTDGVYSLAPVSKPGTGRIGVTKQSQLWVDLDYFGKFTAQEAGAVLVHEYMHIFLRHHERAQALIRNGSILILSAFSQLWNWAADMEINDDLRLADMTLPQGAIYPDSFGFPEHLTAEQYYFMLLDKIFKHAEDHDESTTCSNPGDADSSGDCSDTGGDSGSSANDSSGDAGTSPSPSEGDDDSDSSDDACVRRFLSRHARQWGGDCGSGAGNPYPEEATTAGDSSAQPTEGESQTTGEATGEFAGQTAAQQHNTRMVVAAKINSHGNAPGTLKRLAEELVKVPPIGWDAKFRQVLGRSVAYVEGRGRETYSRRNRNQSALSLFCGARAPVLPGSVQPWVRTAFAIDTSGSVSLKSIRCAVTRGLEIIKASRGEPPLLLVCDAKLHEQRLIKTVDDIRQAITGGGGTNFCPVFDAIAKLPAARRPDILVFYTDGYGDYPDEPPPNLTVIWLNTGRIAVPWGEVIDVHSDEEA